MFGGVAVGDRHPEKSGTDNSDATDQKCPTFDSLALGGCSGLYFESGIVRHHAAPCAATAAWPVAARIALRMRGYVPHRQMFVIASSTCASLGAPVF